MLPSIRVDPGVVRIFLGAAGVLGAWAAVLYVTARSTARALEIELAIRRPHYVQMCAQGAVLLYWGWYVRAVYGFGLFILAQILFAYGVDSLLSWSRRDRYGFGFGPIPVMFSINLFLWFKPEWFHWQFAMIALGFLAKELIRWEKDGRSAHIFNPSSFPLAVASALLILTGTTDRTLGVEIAQTQYNPPHIFAAIFLASIPGQALFGVATMTMTAVVSAYGFGLAYFAVTGTYYFYDAYIPIAVFLGMHLLFTDPSTSPKSETGRVIFGLLYGFGVIFLVVVLDAIGAPTFYDKLLPVPILNLMVRRIDRVAAAVKIPDFGAWAALSVPQRRLAITGCWVAVFLGISGAGGLGDHHPGQYLPFWVEACETTGRAHACDHVTLMQQTYCDRGSGWACNELGIHRLEWAGDRAGARAEFERSCRLSFTPGCDNVLRVATGASGFATGPPPVGELPVVLRGSKGPVVERGSEELYALGCERGWAEMCGGASVGRP